MLPKSVLAHALVTARHVRPSCTLYIEALKERPLLDAGQMCGSRVSAKKQEEFGISRNKKQ